MTEPPTTPQRFGPRVQDSVQLTYDRVAHEYARRIYHELDGKPFDRQLLDRFAARVRRTGLVCDLGCGPGHVARYLSERGVSVTGVDLSPGMVDRARVLNPGIDFQQGDMASLGLPAASVAAIVSFYSIIHVQPASLGLVFREWHRILTPGAPLLLAFHVGTEAIHLDEWWGHDVSIDFFFFDSASVTRKLRESGFSILEASEREPYPDVEHPSRRAYIQAVASEIA
jgi:SAM-dependent methyltransferase